MPDVFSNLAAQSLGSSVGIQPLLLPLFAPAPRLLSDAILPPSDGEAAVTSSLSITPSIFAGGMIPEMEQPSDLLPPDVQQGTIPTASLRHLLQPHHLAQGRMEPVSAASPPSAPAPAADEPSPEHTPVSPHDHSEAQRSDAHSRPNEAGRTSSVPSHAAQPGQRAPAQRQEATSAGPAAPEISPSFTNHSDQEQAGESSPQAAPTKREPQPALPIGTATSPAEREAMLPRQTPVDRPPLVTQRTVQPSPQPSEGIANRDDLPDQRHSSLVQPPAAGMPGKEPARTKAAERGGAGRDRHRPYPAFQPPIVPAIVPVQNATPPVTPRARQEVPDAPGAPEQEGAAANPRRARLISPAAALTSAHAAAPDALTSPQVSPKRETTLAKEEDEAPPIRITIGRVVVRATPAAPPAPHQKRVLRPAQSLSDYLKQRERGSQ